MRLLLFPMVIATLHSQALSVKDDANDDTGALQSALDAACDVHRFHLPAGTYHVSSPLHTSCSMSIEGDGPALSIIVQTVHGTLNHGISTNDALTLQDLSINTTPLTANKGMVAVFRSDLIPGAGQTFTFLRFNSSGFNFGIDIAASADTLGTVLVKDCDISVSTEVNAVANPVNVRNADSLTVEDSTLTGDGNNDHAIYLIGVRRVLIQHNLIQNHGNSAVKLLTGGFHAPVCPLLNNDYSSWVVLNNTITNSKLALAAYTYCDVKLPSLVIADNHISNIPNTYQGDAAAMYIQANCQSVMDQVTMSGNVFTDIGLSGVFLLSSVQGGPPCPEPAARGTINSFTSTGDHYTNFSLSYPGAYSAISASGPNLLHASVSQLTTDGSGHGAQNLGAFAHVASDKKN
ncbi:MAG: right-handed parallel beta-helix repeat-containing protein [Bryobacteraceae bacterium]